MPVSVTTSVLALLGGDATLLLPLLLVAVVLGGSFAVQAWWHRRLEDALARLLRRDPSLQRTTTPCGMTPDALAGRYASTPQGDRRYGLRYGVHGPLTVQLAGRATTVECASFEWWYEQRKTTTGKHGTRRRYVTYRTPVTVARLPATVPAPIRLGPESLLGRLGLSHADDQLESSEFNRRFRVDGQDRTLTVQLLGAGLQQRLVEGFTGRTIDLWGDLLLLGGTPDHRDGSLTGVIGTLPAMRQDVVRLLEAVPAAFWRAVATMPEG